MTYTKKQLGRDLKEKIDKGCSPKKIGSWAFGIFFGNPKEFDPEMHEIIQNLFIMEEGPEFEYSQQELKLLAEMLINDEKNPIEKINKMKFKESD